VDNTADVLSFFSAKNEMEYENTFNNPNCTNNQHDWLTTVRAAIAEAKSTLTGDEAQAK
jgi:hypothetical protein